MKNFVIFQCAQTLPDAAPSVRSNALECGRLRGGRMSECGAEPACPENGLGLGGLVVGIHHERSASDHGLTERFACHHQYPRMAVSVLTVIVVSV
jgi:hypothetical protein